MYIVSCTIIIVNLNCLVVLEIWDQILWRSRHLVRSYCSVPSCFLRQTLCSYKYTEGSLTHVSSSFPHNIVYNTDGVQVKDIWPASPIHASIIHPFPHVPRLNWIARWWCSRRSHIYMKNIMSTDLVDLLIILSFLLTLLCVLKNDSDSYTITSFMFLSL